MKLKNIKDISVRGKKVLVRVDYNVPIASGKVTNNERILSSLKTIKWLLSEGATVILCSHFGRPEGKKNKEFSLKIIVSELEKNLDKKITFVTDCIGHEKLKAIESSKSGDVLLLENVRFYDVEEKNDKDFAHKLAEGCDLYVNDAFSASHRNHASVVAITEFLSSYAGFSLIEEATYLDNILLNPKRPFVVVSGGAKISDKIDVLSGLIQKADVLIIGGAMANTFLAAEGYDVGKSLYEPESENVADDIKRLCDEKGVELILPDDVICAKSINISAKTESKSIDEVEKSDIIVDVGPNTISKYSEPLKFAGMIFWNGPVGISEHKNSAKGTIAVAKIISQSNANSIIGGGDTLAAVNDLDLKFDFVSTGGGATLEFLSGKKLPGLEVLKK